MKHNAGKLEFHTSAAYFDPISIIMVHTILVPFPSGMEQYG